MINNLDLALAMKQRLSVSEVVVTKPVLRQVLDHIIESGNGRMCLNIRQNESPYCYLHKAFWEGIVFIHISKESLEEAPIETASDDGNVR